MIKFKDFINEMAANLGNSPEYLSKIKQLRQLNYEESKNVPKIVSPVNLPLHISLHKETTPKFTNYHTNNHETKETLHKSEIRVRQPTEQLPFTHEEQTHVEKAKDLGLPKNYAENIIYNHFKKSKYPLRSSDDQYIGGHKLWRNLVHKALSDNHHVYFHDGKVLHKTTKDNIEHHLNSYFGEEQDPSGIDYENKHIILSQTHLD